MNETAAGKYLTFALAGKTYGIDILKVHEIIGLMPITQVPTTREFVRGVIVLRHRVTYVVDLRRFFKFEGQRNTERSCIIIVQVNHNEQKDKVGLLVDEVCEVVALKEDQIEPMSEETEIEISREFVLGTARIQKGKIATVVMLLDFDAMGLVAAVVPVGKDVPPSV
ncbi:MAG: chemotaxis protein CheW [Patescibacteria group bacterium]|nr:chemotaxis protein CheW [Patescibacteria group bacterium]